MFENGSYLRRRKRFKTMNDQLKISSEDEQSMSTKKSIAKTSFLIDNLLANDTSTNTSVASSETNPPILQQCFHPTDFDLLRQLTFSQQKIFW